MGRPQRGFSAQLTERNLNGKKLNENQKMVGNSTMTLQLRAIKPFLIRERRKTCHSFHFLWSSQILNCLTAGGLPKTRKVLPNMSQTVVESKASNWGQSACDTSVNCQQLNAGRGWMQDHGQGQQQGCRVHSESIVAQNSKLRCLKFCEFPLT